MSHIGSEKADVRALEVANGSGWILMRFMVIDRMAVS